MANEYILSYTAEDINTRLGKIDNLAEKSEMPKKLSDLTNDSNFATESYVQTQIVAALPEVSSQINAHNAATDAHNDIRAAIENAKTDATNKDIAILAEVQKSISDVQAIIDAKLVEKISYTPQDLTEEQQAQARKNIGVEYTEADAIQLAFETGLIDTVATASGDVLLDKNNTLFTL